MSGDPVEPIAIVGIGCRFPGANGPVEFWDLVREGRFAVREVPEHRVELGFNIQDVYDPRPGTPGKIASPRYGFVDHPELFDPLPFGLTPRDAVGMEPQQRLVVEVVWDALQDAGIPIDSLEGERVAVMIGHMAEDYSREQIAVLGEEGYRKSIDVWAAAGIARAAVSGRVSFLLGVKGPSFTIDTACSSSLLTVHLACQSLMSGESRYAIAGGVNMFLSPEGMIALSRVGMLALDGRCKAFDDRADGFVRAEGAGVVVLRPLADALAANDPVYAVIRGTGFSADGRDGGHMMAPGRYGQVQAMRDAYARAGVDPSTVDFVEAHGTGTPIGDPVEIQALNDVMALGRPKDRPLKVSSIKGNIGHAESASGIAGLIKAALTVHHRALPKQLHFETPSKSIPWDEVPIRVQTEHEAWPEAEPLRVAVNSFGISGTNAHAILDEAPAPAREARRSGGDEASPTARLFLLSGHSPEALRENAERLATHVRAEQASGGLSLRDLGYTLARRRTHRGHRLSVVASTAHELASELDAWAAGEPGPRSRDARCDLAREARVGMVFSGHGSHWFGMGGQLFDIQPVFREAIEEWDAALRAHVDWSLVDVLRAPKRESILERVDVLQSAVAGIAIALARTWERFGVRPSHVVGHSVGEIAAAHIAGCLELADAARVACERGRTIREHAEPGAMGVVACTADALRDELAERREREGDRVWVAGQNAPTLTIVSGEVAAVERLLADLEARGEFARRLNVEYASHCPAMDAPGDALALAVRGICPQRGALPFVSTVHGRAIDGRELDADYWGRNLRAPVLLADSVGAMLDDGADVLLEVSPHPVLGAALGEIAAARAATAAPAAVFSSLRRDEDEDACLLASTGGLFTQGCRVDLEAVAVEGRVASTPLYAYQRREFWFGPKRGSRVSPARSVFGGLIGLDARRNESATEPGHSAWQIELAEDSFESESRQDGVAALPEGELVRMLLAATDELWPEGAGVLERLRFEERLRVPDGLRSLQIAIDRSGESARVVIASRARADTDTRSDWVRHASARVWRREAETGRAVKASPPEKGWNSERDILAGDALYERLTELGLECGSEGRVIERAGFTAGRAAARLAPGCEGRGVAAAFDACHQLLVLVADRAGGTGGSVQLDAVDEAKFDAGSSASALRLELRDVEDGDGLLADVELLDPDGTRVGEIRGVRARVTARSADRASGRWRYGRCWRLVEWPVASAPPSVSPRDWVVIGDDDAFRSELLRALEANGHRCREVATVGDLPTALARRCGVVAIVPAAGEADEQAGSVERVEPVELVEAVEHFSDSLADLSAAGAECVWVATRASQAAPPDDSVGEGATFAATVWEHIASLAGGEEPLRLRCVDCSSRPSAAELGALAELIQSEHVGTDPALALRGRELFAPRFEHAENPTEASESEPLVAARRRSFAVRVGDTSLLDAIDLAEAAPPAPAPAPGEVEVEVRAAGLSFLDVLATMGAGRAKVGDALGWECAGVVTAIGSEVADFAVGDAVFGFARGAASSRVCTPSALLARKPRSLDDVAAAGVPLAEVVARFALERIARLRPGDRLAIHSAGGAIGRAVAALAVRRGARVVATAGSKRKRAMLHSLGVEQVLDSRDLGNSCGRLDAAGARRSSLVRSLGRWAGEAGVDVVLDLSPVDSLLSEEAIFDCLAPGARCIALDHPYAGDLPAPAAPRLPDDLARDLARSWSLHLIDPIGLLLTKPEELSSLLREVATDIEAGRLAVPAPTRFPVAQSTRALRYLSQARHSGKVVLSLAERADLLVRPLRQPGASASWLEGETVLWVGGKTRSGGMLRGWLEQAGAHVECVDADAAPGRFSAAGLMPAVGAVVAVDSSQPREGALAGSLAAARALCDSALGACLQFAWLVTDTSSHAAGETPTGPGAPGAVPALLDALAGRAASLGVPVAHVRISSAAFERAPDGGSLLSHLEHAIGRAELLEIAPGGWGDARSRHPWFSELCSESQSADGAAGLELAALDPENRLTVARDELASALGRVLQLGTAALEQLDWSSAANDLGLDSLMALELKLVLEARLAVELELSALFDGTSLADLASQLCEAASARAGPQEEAT